jgi:hypothetical protein
VSKNVGMRSYGEMDNGGVSVFAHAKCFEAARPIQFILHFRLMLACTWADANAAHVGHAPQRPEHEHRVQDAG